MQYKKNKHIIYNLCTHEHKKLQKLQKKIENIKITAELILAQT